jgi:hypothetical protein
MSRTFRAWTATAALAVSSLPAAPAIAASTAAPTVTVVASGLNEPKHLTFGPGGLYIPEPGTGGSSCVSIGGTSYCEGKTGSITLLGRSGPRKVLSGLPSGLNSAEGIFGAAAVTFEHGKLAVLFQDTAVNPDGSTSVRGPGAEVFGKLLLTRPRSGSAGWSLGPDLAAFAAAHPQDPATLGGIPGGEAVYESNPYDIVAYRGGHAIVDAAANDVLWESPKGRLSVIARLPTTPETVPAGILGPDPVDIDGQAVPTSLAVGPDGALYVGTLPGFPGLPGKAKVYRVLPGRAPVAVVTGLTTVTDLAFDTRGRLLVLEFNTGGLLAPDTNPGALLRVSRSGAVSTLPVGGLVAPAGLAVGPDGAVYVATHGNGPTGSGQVLKITGLG